MICRAFLFINLVAFSSAIAMNDVCVCKYGLNNDLINVRREIEKKNFDKDSKTKKQVQRTWEIVQQHNSDVSELKNSIKELVPTMVAVREELRKLLSSNRDEFKKYQLECEYDRLSELNTIVRDAVRLGLLKLFIENSIDKELLSFLEDKGSNLLEFEEWAWFDLDKAEVAEPLEEEYVRLISKERRHSPQS